MFLIPSPPAPLQTQQIPQSEDGQIAMGIILLISLIVSMVILIGVMVIGLCDTVKWYRKIRDKNRNKKKFVEIWKKIENKGNNKNRE